MPEVAKPATLAEWRQGTPQRGPNPDHPPSVIWRALVKSRGMVTMAAGMVPCHPATIYRTIERYPQMRDDLAELREIVKPAAVEKAKTNILQAVDQGDERWSAWLLERWDKANFSTRTEHTGPDGGPIQHLHIADGGFTDEELASLSGEQLAALRIAKHAELQLRQRRIAAAADSADRTGGVETRV
jgi:hypothetical protein